MFSLYVVLYVVRVQLTDRVRFTVSLQLTKEHIQSMQDNPITFHCCPPEGNLAKLLTLTFATFAILLAAEAVLGHHAAPGGNIFALLVLILFALIHRVPKRMIQKHYECIQAILNHIIPKWWQKFPMVRTF